MTKEQLAFPLVLLGSSIIGVVVGNLEPLLALPIYIGYGITILAFLLLKGEE